MSAYRVIIKHEFLILVRRLSFILTTLGLPLVAAVLLLVLNLLGGSPGKGIAELLPKAPTKPQGYVDHANLVDHVPAPLAGVFAAYESEQAAQAAAQAGEVDGYYVIPPDFLSKGELLYCTPDFSPLAAEGRSSAFMYVIQANLAGDDTLGALVWQPLRLQIISLAGEQEAEETELTSYWLPYAFLMILFLSLVMASGWLLQSVTREKETRMMEVILSSVSPFQMLVGKTVGLGLVGLVQLCLWLVSALVLLRTGGHVLSLPQGFEIKGNVIIWGVVYFLLGYSLYAALIAGLGALSPSLRDASQATFLVYLPLMVPLWLINAIISNPGGALSVALSLFPFTSPVVIMMRLAKEAPPLWQLLAAGALLLLTAYYTLRLIARLFRAQTLLSGQPLSVARLRDALRSQ